MDNNTLTTIYVFCSDYHSGQWSRGYRLLCRIHNYLGISHLSDGYIDELRDTDTYRELVSKYEGKV